MIKPLKNLLVFTTMSEAVKLYLLVFMNLYLWLEEKSLDYIIFSNIIVYSLTCISFYVGIKLIRTKSLVLMFQLSSIFNLLLFSLVVFFPKENFMLWVVIVALFNGVSRGFYTVGRNIGMSSLIKNGDDMLRYSQLEMLYGRMIQIVFPIISVFLIQLGGYNMSFSFMILFSGIILYFSTRLVKIEPFNIQTKLRSSLTIIKEDNKIKMMIKTILHGAFFPEFITICTFYFMVKFSENEFFVAGISIISSLIIFLLIKISKISKNSYLYIIIGIVTGISSLLLLFIEGSWTFVAINLLMTVSTFYYNSSFYSDTITATIHLPEDEKIRLAFVRESLIMACRILMLVIIYFVGLDSNLLFLTIAVLIITLPTPYFINKLNKLVSEPKK